MSSRNGVRKGVKTYDDVGDGVSLKIVPTCRRLDAGRWQQAYQLASGSSLLFDTVAIVASEKGAATLMREAAAVAWVHDAFAQLNVIAYSNDAQSLSIAAGVDPDDGIIGLADIDSAVF